MGPFFTTAMKIHLSEDTKIILEAFPEFKVEKRGWIEVKVRIYIYTAITLQFIII